MTDRGETMAERQGFVKGKMADLRGEYIKRFLVIDLVLSRKEAVWISVWTRLSYFILPRTNDPSKGNTGTQMQFIIMLLLMNMPAAADSESDSVHCRYFPFPDAFRRQSRSVFWSCCLVSSP